VGGRGQRVRGRGPRVRFAPAPPNLGAASPAGFFRAGTAPIGAGTSSRHGYGRGGYTVMPHATEAAAATTMNWSGYAAAVPAGQFTSVSSSWVVAQRGTLATVRARAVPGSRRGYRDQRGDFAHRGT
jgi:hypothetical protein